jgi:hypothetical protein
MTSQEFVLWLKGFSEGVHEYNITPKQWDILKDKLAQVKDEPKESFPIYPKQPNTGTIQTLPFIQPYPSDPYNPYKVYCGDTNGVVLTTSNGSSGSITYNPSTSTTYGYPSGSAWSYTNTLSTNRWNEHQAKMADYRPYQPYTTGGEDEIVKHHNED